MTVSCLEYTGVVWLDVCCYGRFVRKTFAPDVLRAMSGGELVVLPLPSSNCSRRAKSFAMMMILVTEKAVIFPPILFVFVPLLPFPLQCGEAGLA